VAGFRHRYESAIGEQSSDFTHFGIGNAAIQISSQDQSGCDGIKGVGWRDRRRGRWLLPVEAISSEEAKNLTGRNGSGDRRKVPRWQVRHGVSVLERSFADRTFADAVKHYREVFAPRMLRDSTFSTADGHLKNHLEPDWKDVPIDHITIDTINDWAWKKKREGLSWVTIKNVLRTMQRVLSASSKSKTVPFSQDGLAIPERVSKFPILGNRLCELSRRFSNWRP
jgi:hypothetical protein